MNCIFLCRIWKIQNIQTVKTIPCFLFPVSYSLFPIPCPLFPVTYSLFPIPCPLFPVPCPNRQLFQQALITYPICNSPVHVRQNIEYGNGNL